MKHRWKILLVLVVAIVVVAALFVRPTGYRGALEDYKRELRAKGEKLTIVEVAPKHSATASPGAIAFMALTNLEKWPTNMPSRMITVAPGRARIGYTNLTADQLQGYEQNFKTMAALRAALGAGAFDFNLDYSRGFEVLLPHLSRIKQAEQMASGTALQALFKNDYEEAWADILAAADVVAQPVNEPILISDLVRVADVNIAIPTTWEAIESHPWTEAQLADLQARWERLDLFTNAGPILAMERAADIDALVQARKSRNAYQRMFGLQSGVTGTPTPNEEGLANWVNGLLGGWPAYVAWKIEWSYDEELCNLREIGAAIDTARRIRSAGAAYPALNELPLQFTNIAALHPNASNHFYLFQPGFGQVYCRSLEKLADAEAYRRLLVTAIALKRYQLAHGANPANLNELVPQYLARLPIDFMDGKPLRYRLQPDGEYLLYSVGRDIVDSGGGGDDHVWPRPATLEQIEDYSRRVEATTAKPGK